MLTNGWIGKVVLTSVALAFAPAKPLYALLFILVGFALGYEWDLHAAQRWRVGGAVASHKALLAAAERDPWPIFLLCGLGRIASAGGAVLPGHIERAEQAIGELGFAAEDRRRAISWFNAGKQPDCPFSELAARCSRRTDPEHEARVLSWFASIAGLEDRAEAHQAMQDLMGLLRYRGARLDGEADTAAGPASNGGLAGRPVESPAYLAALKFFELEPEPSIDVVKAAYRRFVSRCHPDRLPQRATEAEVALAQRRMVEGRAAYEELLLVLGERR
ncbi:MAG: hypothetical protein AAGG11_15970 [Pseudomonadota bacterium]